jgi:hypothetical protein
MQSSTVGGGRPRRKADAKDERVRSTIGLVPALLDQVDELIAKGVIGGQEPNAADYAASGAT